MLVAAAIAATLLTGGAAQDVAPPLQPQVRCDTGPIEREYGGLPWLVFSCSNGGVIFGGKPGSPADSTLFIWAPSAEGFTLTLETGLADATPLQAAQAELAAMTIADLERLGAEARQVGRP